MGALDGQYFHLAFIRLKIMRNNLFRVIQNISSCSFEVVTKNILEFLFVIVVWNKKNNFMILQPSERWSECIFTYLKNIYPFYVNDLFPCVVPSRQCIRSSKHVTKHKFSIRFISKSWVLSYNGNMITCGRKLEISLVKEEEIYTVIQ